MFVEFVCVGPPSGPFSLWCSAKELQCELTSGEFWVDPLSTAELLRFTSNGHDGYQYIRHVANSFLSPRSGVFPLPLTNDENTNLIIANFLRIN